MSSKDQNRSSNVIFLSSNGTIETQQPTYKIINTNQKIEYVKGIHKNFKLDKVYPINIPLGVRPSSQNKTLENAIKS